MSTATLHIADAAAHDMASHVRTARPAPKPRPRVIARFPAGAPRGSWPAEEFAQQLRRDGQTVDVVMDLASDTFLVVAKAES